MRRPIRALLSGVAGGLLAALTVAPIGIAAAETATDVEMQDEAWFFRYRNVPAETLPDGGLPDPGGSGVPAIAEATVRDQTNPYPNTTLHVGVNAGEPEARTFLGFKLFELGGGLPPVVTGGSLTFTAFEGASAGTRNLDAADMVACAATDLVVSAQGGDWLTQPPYDEALCSPLVRVEGASPATWTLDLAPFAGRWADPAANFGVAVVENPAIEAPAPDQTWHVAFFANNFVPEPSPVPTGEEPPMPVPITGTFEFIKQEIPTFDTGAGLGGSGALTGGSTAGTSGSPGFTGGGGSSGSNSAGFSSGSTSGSTSGSSGGAAITAPAAAPQIATAEAPEIAEPATEQPVGEAAEAAVAAAPALTPAVSDVRPQSLSTVWLLALLGTALAGGLAWSLSQPIELVAHREGAVSHLIRRRAGAPSPSVQP